MNEIEKNMGKEYELPKAASIDPNLITLAKLIEEGVLKHQEKDIESLQIELKDRWRITLLIVGAILTIIIILFVLTLYGKFEIATFSFLLGTSVGSLLTILGKMFTISSND
jgi:t-SNARE complex subunit (syntaxin)